MSIIFLAVGCSQRYYIVNDDATIHAAVVLIRRISRIAPQPL